MTGYFIAPDGHDEPTLWRGTPDDLAPKSVIRRCDVGDATVWRWLVAMTALLPDEMTAARYELSDGRTGTYIGQPSFYAYGSETDQRMQGVPPVPSVYVSDDGYVDIEGDSVPTEVFPAWARAVVAEMARLKDGAR